MALAEMAKRQGLEKVYLHCFMDGRDVAPTSGKGYIEQVQAKLKELGVGKIATVIGRYYAMDRDNRWERVQQAYNAMVLGEGVYGEDPAAMVQKSYDEDVTDEFIKPIGYHGKRCAGGYHSGRRQRDFCQLPSGPCT